MAEDGIPQDILSAYNDKLIDLQDLRDSGIMPDTAQRNIQQIGNIIRVARDQGHSPTN